MGAVPDIVPLHLQGGGRQVGTHALNSPVSYPFPQPCICGLIPQRRVDAGAGGVVQQYLRRFLTVMGQVLRAGLPRYLNTFLPRLGYDIHAFSDGNMWGYTTGSRRSQPGKWPCACTPPPRTAGASHSRRRNRYVPWAISSSLSIRWMSIFSVWHAARLGGPDLLIMRKPLYTAPSSVASDADKIRVRAFITHVELERGQADFCRAGFNLAGSDGINHHEVPEAVNKAFIFKSVF